MPANFLDIKTLAKERFEELLNNSFNLLEISERDIKKVPTLRGKTIINLFLEPSTRTRSSFEIAAKWLSADAINISESGSSVKKGETLYDTAKNLEAMSPDIIVLRHKESGASHFLSKNLLKASIVNAGDGMNEHPSQALLDCLALKKHFNSKIKGLKIAILGDIIHSRVARSNIYAHILLGNKINLVGPTTLVPNELKETFKGVEIFHDLTEGIKGCDVIMCLRMQLERQNAFFVPSFDEYSRMYCLNEDVIKKYASEAVVIHPGPMNRGMEITSEVADGFRSLIQYQVKCGVASRMAILLSLIKNNSEEKS